MPIDPKNPRWKVKSASADSMVGYFHTYLETTCDALRASMGHAWRAWVIQPGTTEALQGTLSVDNIGGGVDLMISVECDGRRVNFTLSGTGMNGVRVYERMQVKVSLGANEAGRWLAAHLKKAVEDSSR